MSEPLSILLHAAARGARLQKNFGYGMGGWDEIPWCNLDGYNCRIHPKDRHLRYGPISRVLFEAAKNPPGYLHHVFDEESAVYEAAFFYACEFRHVDESYSDMKKRDEKSHYLLFVAEALAHEGL